MDIKQTEQAVVNVAKRDLQAAMNMVHDSLVTHKTNAKLPEDIFKFYFLPYMSGQQPIPDNINLISEWISIAGTPMSEVDIINEAGNVIFTVPSLFDTNNIDVTSRDKGSSLSDIYSQYELRNNNVPIAAVNFLKKALNEKTSTMLQSSPESKATVQAWMDIYARYGIVAETAIKVIDEDDGSDDLIYD